MASALIERRSIDYVPLAERHGKVWHLWPVWFCGDANLVTLSVGIIGIAMGGNLLWTAVALLAGGAFGTFFMAAHSAQGPQMGLPQLIQSRPQFGYRGALLVYLVAIVTYLGYNAFNQILSGQTLHALLGWPTIPAALAFTLAAMIMAIAGYRWFHLLQRWLAYVLILALLGYTIGIVMLQPFSATMLAPSGFVMVPFVAQFFAAAAYQLSWAIYVSDYSRYLPRDVSVAASFWWTYVGAFIGGGWMMLVGASAAALAPGQDVAVGVVLAGDMIHAGFGPILLLLAVLGLLSSAAQNFYGASLTLLSIVNTFVRWPVRLVDRVSAMVVCGLVAMAIALGASGDFAAGFNDFLSILLYLFTPWTAINLVDFYLIRHGHFSIRAIFDPDGIYGKWNWRGIGAYFAGFAAMIPFFSLDRFHGPVARLLGGADVSMPIGLVVAAALYALACRSQDIAGELRQLPALDAGLEPETVTSLS